jgi:hypothetical protein
MSKIPPGAEKQMSLPLFIAELSDFPKLLRSISRLWTVCKNLRRKPKILNGTLVESRLGDLARALSGADLARKFGAEPAFTELSTYVNETTSKLVGAHEAFERWLKARNKHLTGHRQVGRNTVDTTQQVFGARSLLPYIPDASRVDVWDDSGREETTLSDGTSESRSLRFSDVRSLYSNAASMGPPGITGGLPLLHLSQTVSERQKLTLFYSYDVYDIAGWELDDDELRRRWALDRLGLYADPTVLWDKIPFSFLIDWLINFRPFIEQWSLRNIEPTYTVWGAMVSSVEEKSITLTPQRFYRQYDRGDAVVTFEGMCGIESDSRHFTFRRYRRQFVEPDPTWFGDAELSVRIKTPSWWKLLTAVELLDAVKH